MCKTRRAQFVELHVKMSAREVSKKWGRDLRADKGSVFEGLELYNMTHKQRENECTFTRG